MPVTVDLEQRRVLAAVTELITDPRGRGRNGHSVGALGRFRVQLGQRVHDDYRRTATEQHGPAFTAEVAVRIEREIDGFSVRLHGRIDGLVRRAGSVHVEEVKSVASPAEELRRCSVDDFPTYALQLRLYALALIDAGDEPTTMTLALRLVSLLDGSHHELPVELEREATERRLFGLVRAAIRAAHRSRQRADFRRRVAPHVAFPFAAMRPYQAEFMAALRDGLADERPVLAMAPTGLGKTVAALVPGLREALRRGAPLHVLTAKRTQREHVAAAFEQIRSASAQPARPLLAITLRAKAEMCPPGHLVCHSDVCPYLEGTLRREPTSSIARWVERGGHVGADEIYRVGAAERVCPFELALELAAVAELVIGDYNLRYGELLGRAAPNSPAVVIIDEAHNLAERARQQLSPRLRRADIDRALHAVRAGRPTYGSRLAAQLGLTSNWGSAYQPGSLVALLSDLAAWVDDGSTPTAEAFVEPLDQLAERSAAALLDLAWQARRRGSIWRDDALHDVLREVLRVHEAARTSAPQLVPHVYGRDDREAARGILCLDAAPWLEARHRRVGGIVAMSATLFPLAHHRRSLGLAPLDPVCITTPSPFPRAHRRIIITTAIDTTYRHRTRYAAQIAALVQDVAAVKRGRYVVFFSSFRFLDEVSPHLDGFAGGVYRQTANAAAAERERLLGDFRRHQGAALLLAVMGGAFAEGLDFPGDQLVGAFIVGPGLPPVDGERERIARYFAKSGRGGFAHAYVHPGLQRVVQAAGRVIRSEDDRGIIVLIGRRFAVEPYRSCLPRDWYEHSPGELVCTDPVAAAAEFWASVAMQPHESPPSAHEAIPPSSSAVG